MGVAVVISLLSYIRAEILVIAHLLPVMAAIFDFQPAQTYDSIRSSLSVLPDPGDMSIAVGISLLSCVQAEISATEF